jgi:amino-acid N-acetyltransferase
MMSGEGSAGWRIGRLGPERLPELCRLLSDAGLPVDDLDEAKLEHFLVAEDDEGRFGGAVGLEITDDAALLRSLVVDPARRGDGLGGLLVGAIEEAARSAGVSTMYLLTDTAAGFFPGLGHRQTERNAAPSGIRETSEFRELCPDSAVCFAKRL